jgi:hypothetical protein
VIFRCQIIQYELYVNALLPNVAVKPLALAMGI